MAESEGRPSFIVDAMLGRLAKSLRTLGYDTSSRPDIDDEALTRAALREGRVLLTRDREVAATSLPVRVVLITSDHLAEQLVQTVRELDLTPGPELFTRCLICNVPVEDVPRPAVEGLVPTYVFETQERFARCPSCERVYWAATHVEHAREWFESVLAPVSGVAASDLGENAAGSWPAARNLFVTGRPGVGKTTLIERVLETVAAEAGGFYTREVREGGERVGFSIVGLNGTEGELARVGLKSDFNVGRYGVNREDLERVGVASLEAAIEGSALIVMDEIGRMELCSELFQRAVMRALDSPTPVFGTVQDSSNAFLDAVRERRDVDVIRVDEGNRDGLVDELTRRVAGMLAEARGEGADPGTPKHGADL